MSALVSSFVISEMFLFMIYWLKKLEDVSVADYASQIITLTLFHVHKYLKSFFSLQKMVGYQKIGPCHHFARIFNMEETYIICNNITEITKLDTKADILCLCSLIDFSALRHPGNIKID